MRTPETIINQTIRWYTERSAALSSLQRTFLNTQAEGLRQMADLILLRSSQSSDQPQLPQKPLFDAAALNEFAAGSIVNCLGDVYSIYDGRQCPRIPNTDLLMMSRILEIEGQKRSFEPGAAITAAYDVPLKPWYMTGDTSSLPISMMMEIGLQPCGFLAAWLETALQLPEIDFYFRNLDGQLSILHSSDPRGKTVLTRATLLKSFTSGSTIIQEFAFELTMDNGLFCEGQTSFGFFPLESIRSQNGIDAGKKIPPWLQENRQVIEQHSSVTVHTSASGKLNLLDEMTIVPQGGLNHAGYIYGSRKNSAQDWFYACHFKGDPVMPGSLGIEAIVQACHTYILQLEPQAKNIRIATDSGFSWKYRGQILRQHQQMQIEVHFMPLSRTENGFVLCGDASIWADDIRIYQANQLCIQFQK